MSCICQYVRINSSPHRTDIRVSFGVATSTSSETAAEPNQNAVETSKEPVSDDAKIAVCVSELANFRAENWLLKKKLNDYEVTIENLEQLMSTIVSKQQQVLSEMIHLRKRNSELETECNLQREYHASERNALIKEVHELKTQSKDQLCALHSGENLNRSADSQDTMSESDSDDEDCRYDHDSDEESVSTISSIESTGRVSITTYSADSQSEDTEESGDESREYSTATETESD